MYRCSNIFLATDSQMAPRSMVGDLHTINRLVWSLSKPGQTSPDGGNHTHAAVVASVLMYLLEMADAGQWSPTLDNLLQIMTNHLQTLVVTKPSIVPIIIKNGIVQYAAALLAFFVLMRHNGGAETKQLHALVGLMETLLGHVRSRGTLLGVVTAFTTRPMADGPLHTADFFGLLRPEIVQIVVDRVALTDKGTPVRRCCPRSPLPR